MSGSSVLFDLVLSHGVRLGVNHVFGCFKRRKSSEEEMLVLGVHAVVLDRVAEASNFFH